jgi:8-oxo-dGTP pyrophosphatase MutT (NUDIX family)
MNSQDMDISPKLSTRLSTTQRSDGIERHVIDAPGPGPGAAADADAEPGPASLGRETQSHHSQPLHRPSFPRPGIARSLIARWESRAVPSDCESVGSEYKKKGSRQQQQQQQQQVLVPSGTHTTDSMTQSLAITGVNIDMGVTADSGHAASSSSAAAAASAADSDTHSMSVCQSDLNVELDTDVAQSQADSPGTDPSPVLQRLITKVPRYNPPILYIPTSNATTAAYNHRDDDDDEDESEWNEAAAIGPNDTLRLSMAYMHPDGNDDDDDDDDDDNKNHSLSSHSSGIPFSFDDCILEVLREHFDDSSMDTLYRMQTKLEPLAAHSPHEFIFVNMVSSLGSGSSSDPTACITISQPIALLTLSRMSTATRGMNLPLAHAPLCPMRELKLQKRELQFSDSNCKPPLRTGVVVLVSNEKGQLLFTRRSARMRSFPRAWVFPGGGIDAGESLAECGAREVLEETGIKVNMSSMVPLCIWESVYPTRVDLGDPKAHHFVVYYTALADTAPLPSSSSASSWQSTQRQQLHCDHIEVDTVCWVNPDVVNSLVAQDIKTQSSTTVLTSSSAELDGFKVSEGDVMEPYQVPVKDMSGIYPNSLGTGLARGHFFALEVLARNRHVHARARNEYPWLEAHK